MARDRLVVRDSLRTHSNYLFSGVLDILYPGSMPFALLVYFIYKKNSRANLRKFGYFFSRTVRNREIYVVAIVKIQNSANSRTIKMETSCCKVFFPNCFFLNRPKNLLYRRLWENGKNIYVNLVKMSINHIVCLDHKRHIVNEM